MKAEKEKERMQEEIERTRRQKNQEIEDLLQMENNLLQRVNKTRELKQGLQNH
eukprot:CAMPEP_0116904424 /NCGR_PEP_ID=MMETSP0467-20121206/11420_1 /TAXON_ID=283647 /ORGANISM="Mesodinium pulex, Strain SPMC105" /LENGTH=52 /DNA_ID=CAMNT_0004579085 /DNA_START=75 /DNA_END=233 /DNA_ORIENTATION=+